MTQVTSELRDGIDDEMLKSWLATRPYGHSRVGNVMHSVHELLAELARGVSFKATDHRIRVVLHRGRLRDGLLSYSILIDPTDPAIPALILDVHNAKVHRLKPNAKRQAILDIVIREPGLACRTIATRIGAVRRVADHHLAILEASGAVHCIRDGTRQAWYPGRAP